MKELYLDAELEIVKFSIADVITTSGENENTDPTLEPTSTYATDPDDGELDQWVDW